MSDRFVTDAFDDAQLHNLLCQQSQRPLTKSCGRVSQTQGDNLGFLLARELFEHGWSGAFFTVEGDVKAFDHEALTEILHGFGAAIERLSDALVSPIRPIGISFKQNLGATKPFGQTLVVSG